MKVTAPWTDEQVDALNRWQATDFVHPFTCPWSEHDNEDHAAFVATVGRDGRVLVATPDGWWCPICNYAQNWAHDFMFNEPKPVPLGNGQEKP